MSVWPDPTPEMLDNPLFNAIWNRIKGYDVRRPDGCGYHGATGTDARAILDAIQPIVAAQVAAAAEAMREKAKAVAKEKAVALSRITAIHRAGDPWSVAYVDSVATDIAALPIEHGDALAAAVAQAVKDEREACAQVADELSGSPCKIDFYGCKRVGCSATRHDWERTCIAEPSAQGTTIAAAIRARGEGGGHE